MTPHRSLLSLCLASIPLVGCADVYEHPDFDALTADHEQIAVLPAAVWFEAGVAADASTADAIADAERAIGRKAQEAVHHTLKVQDEPLGVGVLSLAQTEMRLEEAGLWADAAAAGDPATLAEALDVDAVVMAEVDGEALLSDRAAVGISVLAAVFGEVAIAPTSGIDVTVSLHDADDGLMLWSCTQGDIEELGQSAWGLTQRMLVECSDEFPYRR